ncbi:MAG TPA: hypothetical protein VMY88_11305 [Acidimicrobiales bacterium]|nr:hypothetical protein [Acidimicrobiales bacterium]
MAMATDGSSAAGTDDPFERALAREEAYRARRSRGELLGFPSTIFRTFRWLAVGFAAAWGGLLALHWSVFADPRWLVVLHTMVYGVGLIYFTTMLVAFTVMQKKPAAFGLVDDES